MQFVHFILAWLVVALTALTADIETTSSFTDDPEVGNYVVMEIEQNGQSLGNMTLGLFRSTVPKTVENFYLLAKLRKYKGTTFHRVIKEFMVQGGDIGGQGGYSIYGSSRGSMPDENFALKHDRIGRLAMANAGPDSALSQFYITTKVTSWLDGHYVVFGQLLEGLDVLKSIEATTTDSHDKPLEDVIISNIYTYDKDRNLDTELTDEEKKYASELDESVKLEEETKGETDKNAYEKIDSNKNGGEVASSEKGDDKLDSSKDSDSHNSDKSDSSSTPSNAELADQREKEREKTRPKYSQYYVLLPMILFAAFVIFIMIKSRRSIMYTIRGPRYRRIRVHR